MACRVPGIGCHGPPAVAVAAVASTRRPFHLVNIHTGHVLEIQNGLTSAGAHLQVGRRQHDKVGYQLWHIDATGLIRSIISDFVIQCRGIGDRVTIGPHNASPYQCWIFDHNRIICRLFPAECLEVRRGELRDGADIVLHRYESKPWQHWRLDYI